MKKLQINVNILTTFHFSFMNVLLHGNVLHTFADGQFNEHHAIKLIAVFRMRHFAR